MSHRSLVTSVWLKFLWPRVLNPGPVSDWQLLNEQLDCVGESVAFHQMSGRVNLLCRIPSSIIFFNGPFMVHVEEFTNQLVDCIFCLHLNIHCHKKGEEEQNPTGEGHQFTGRKFCVRTNPWLNISVLFETENGDNGAGDHDSNGCHED